CRHISERGRPCRPALRLRRLCCAAAGISSACRFCLLISGRRTTDPLTPPFLICPSILGFLQTSGGRIRSGTMANPQHEPTMEEILASIRKIIAEDPAGGESASASPAESDEPEVLNLTQEVHEESTVTASAPTQAGEEQATTDANDTATHSSEGIFSDKARKALSDAFAGLEPESHQTGNEQVPSMSGLPLE